MRESWDTEMPTSSTIIAAAMKGKGCRQNSGGRRPETIEAGTRRRRRRSDDSKGLGLLVLMVICAALPPPHGTNAAAAAASTGQSGPFRNPFVSRRSGGGSSSDAEGLYSPDEAAPPEEIIRKLEREQIFDQLEELGLGVLAEEAGEKKRLEIARGVARGCAVGAQMTLFMGGVALLFRLWPILLGHDLEDDEDNTSAASYILHAGIGSTQAALPAVDRRRLLTEAGEGVEGDQAFGEGEGEGKESKAGGSDNDGAMVEVGEGSAGEVVAFSKWRDTLRKSRRVSRPLLKAMAVSLALLGLARLVLGDLLAETINPMDELLFGDDLTKLYSDKAAKPPREALPFPLDSDMMPGRTRIKGKGVQRSPRPMGEEDGQGERGGVHKGAGLLDIELDDGDEVELDYEELL